MKKSTIVLSVLLVFSLAVTWASFNALRSREGAVQYDPSRERLSLMEERAKSFIAKGDLDMAETVYTMIVAGFPDSASGQKALRWKAERNLEKGDLKKALYYHERLVREYPEIEDIHDIRRTAEALNLEIMRSSLVTPDSIEYTVERGDTLYDIARNFNTTVALIKKMNDLRSDVIHIGQRLKISTARFSILVDKAQNILKLKKDGNTFKTYSVATGTDNSTPEGVFRITEKLIEPVWTKPGGGLVMPDSEEYELGARWMAISEPGYGIHGTNDETSIGAQTTAGCVRMFNRDVIELYNMVPVGTEVTIIDSSKKSAQQKGT